MFKKFSIFLVISIVLIACNGIGGNGNNSHPVEEVVSNRLILSYNFNLAT